MTEPKWTPGPWHVEASRLNPHDECYVTRKDGGFIAETFIEANAHLIAAAPDLYAATDLPGINGIEFSDTMADDSKMELHLTVGQFRALQAARRKARGE